MFIIADLVTLKHNDAQTHRNIRCSHTQSMNIDKGSCQDLDL